MNTLTYWETFKDGPLKAHLPKNETATPKAMEVEAL